MCAQVFSTLSRTSGCRWAWMETFISLTRWRRTAGETTAALPPSLEYEPLFRRLPCLSLSRQVGVYQGGLSSLACCLPREAAWCNLWFVFRALIIPNMFTDVHFHSCTSKAIQVSHCLACVHLLGFMLWIWSWWCLSWCFPHCPHVHCDFFFVCVSSTSISEKTDMSPETGKLEAFRVKHPSSVLPL